MKSKPVLLAILLIATMWQPTHHYLMSSGMAMSSEVHSLVMMCPFFAFLLSYFPFKLGIMKSKEKAVIYIPSDF